MFLPHRPARPNLLTGSRIDRVAPRRAEADWVRARLHDEDSHFTLVWRSQSLLADGPRAALLPGLGGLAASHPWAFLGLLDGRAVFALDLGGLDDPLAALPPDAGAFADLRATAASLDAPEASMLAHARGLLHWRARHRYCGVCGAPTRPSDAGNRVSCTGCGTEHFARTDPAVIMLVSHGERVLLGHARRFTGNMYSTLAGFVEPGESLEEAVAREVREEAGIEVTDIVYHSSQPWPFPASLMLGFYARALDERIVLDDDELADARWFSRDELRDHAALGFDLPGPISIARRLIEDWLAAAPEF
jgi:NAD+ diphosphatase